MNGVKHSIVYRVTGELMLVMLTSDQQSPLDSLQSEFDHGVRAVPKVAGLTRVTLEDKMR